MNAKKVFWGATDSFLKRNRNVLPQAQLHTGANERWFVREFAIAMNRHFGGSWAPTKLQPYADCERSYADISVWAANERRPVALYEAKVLYNHHSEPLVGRIVERAYDQLIASPWLDPDRRIGLFFAVYCAPDRKSSVSRSAIKGFKDRVRKAVRGRFRSDHDIRMTLLSPLSQIKYQTKSGLQAWHTKSWLTWGMPRT